jgi:hypothetical protein
MNLMRNWKHCFLAKVNVAYQHCEEGKMVDEIDLGKGKKRKCPAMYSAH